MTDHHRSRSYVVVLDEDLRQEDVPTLMAAIGLLRGVAAIETYGADIQTEVANMQATADRIVQLLDDDIGQKR